MDSIPMIVISGNVPNSLIGNDAFKECDIVGVSRPIVKHSFLVKKAEDIPDVVKKAFYISTTGRPGPVVIDLPKDILNPQIKLLKYGNNKNAFIEIKRAERTVRNGRILLGERLFKIGEWWFSTTGTDKH